MKKLLILLSISQTSWADIIKIEIFSIPKDSISEFKIKDGISIMEKSEFAKVFSKKIILPTSSVSCNSLELCSFAFTEDTSYLSEIKTITNESGTVTSLTPGNIIVGYNGTIAKDKSNIYKVKYNYSHLKEIREIKSDFGTIQAPDIIRKSLEYRVSINANQVWVNNETNYNSNSWIVITTEASK